LINTKDVIYLEDSSVELYGYKFYGSPYSNKYRQWAFMKSDENLKEIWSKIPTETDILITHGPPKFIGDLTVDKVNSGSRTLLEEVKNRIKPLYHIFGHIHEGYGIYNCEDISTYFINCSNLNEDYDCVNKPIVFELEKR